MKIDESIQQPGQKERALKNDIMKSLHVAIPGEIVSYDSTQRTAVIQPVIREWNCKDNPPLLLDVPVFMWGNFTFTPTKGDGCLVVCADSCIDSWIQSGGVSTPIVARTHSLSDGFAFVGFNQEGGTDLPTVLANKKDKQTAVVDPTASGNALSFIDSIVQNENGDITVTKKTVYSASENQSGIVTTEGQIFSGEKTFYDAPVVSNTDQNAYIRFKGKSQATRSGAFEYSGVGDSEGAYLQGRFTFYQYSPKSDGTGITNYSEKFRLPQVNLGRTTNGTYDILTTKDSLANNLTTTASGLLALDAHQGKVLNDGKIDKIPGRVTLSADSSVSLSLSSITRHLFIIDSAQNTLKSIMLVYVGTSGNVTHVEAITGSNLTITTSTNTLTIKNTHSSSAAYIYQIPLDSLF